MDSIPGIIHSHKPGRHPYENGVGVELGGCREEGVGTWGK